MDAITISSLISLNLQSAWRHVKRFIVGVDSSKVTLRHAIYVLMTKKRTKLYNLKWKRKIKYSDRQNFLIAFDAMQIIPGVSGGVETYLAMLLNGLRDSDFFPILLCHPIQEKEFLRDYSELAQVVTIDTSLALKLLARYSFMRPKLTVLYRDSVSFSRLGSQLNVRILHSPVQIFTAFDFDLPSVLNLHDMQHKYLPEHFSEGDLAARDYLYKVSATKADQIIASSDFVAQDINHFLDIPYSKIRRIDVAWNQGFKGALEAPTKPNQFSYTNFLFYPAQFWPHKNHSLLLRTLMDIRKLSGVEDLKLVFTGSLQGENYEHILSEIREQNLTGEIQILGKVSLSELAWLYIHARATVVPSLFEASSYPIIEAQLAHSVVITASTTSLPELVRDGAGYLFDPQDPSEFVSIVVNVLQEKYDLEEVKLRAFTRVQEENSVEALYSSLEALYLELMRLEQ